MRCSLALLLAVATVIAQVTVPALAQDDPDPPTPDPDEFYAENNLSKLKQFTTYVHHTARSSVYT